MEPQLIKGSSIERQDKGANRVQNLLSTEPSISITVVEKIGISKLTMNPAHDMMFYVLDGQTNSVLDGKELVIEKGDLLVVPKGVVFKNGPGVTLLSITTPRFDARKTVHLE
jgi:mannose-6-phosphate isomerase-like protein (cupin superfamily)